MVRFVDTFFKPKPVDAAVSTESKVPYIMEDLDLKGGIRVVTDISARDAIKKSARKAGMLVVTADTFQIWQLQQDMNAFVELPQGQQIVGVNPISVQVNGDVAIDPNYTIPQNGIVGDFVVKDIDGKPAWKTVNLAGNTGTRIDVTHTAALAIDPLSHYDFDLDMSSTILTLKTLLDVPNVKLEGFSTVARDDLNPYTFISTPEILSDSGITLLADGSQYKNRRYNIIANLETPVSNKIYWRMTNLSELPITPTVSFTFLIL